MAYKGKITNLNNPQKYVGDIDKIVYRSLWERNAMRWVDDNPNIIEWASEEMVVPYQHPIYGRRAKYYPDLFLKMSDGTYRVIEIKPAKETVAPSPKRAKTKRFYSDVATWAINSEKWKEATLLCKKNNMTFEVWTEDTLESMGISTNSKSVSQSILLRESSSRPKLKKVAARKPKPRAKARPRPVRKS